jgi:ribose transport system ATP-binding protein
MTALLQMRGVEKRFGGVHALSGVDLEVEAGEVHALVGENGAGKSTLMKVLSGAHRPDAGEMKLARLPYAPTGPLDARRHGVAMIYQELNLAPELTVEDNVMLGREVSRFGTVRREEARGKIEEALSFLGHEDISVGATVESLGPARRQVVEIARALVDDARVVVMDEPTSSLARRDVEKLFEVVRRLRDSGVAIIYISHFLEEVEQLADRYTVLRDGETVGTGEVREDIAPTLVELMVGRPVDEVFPAVYHERGDVLLELDGLAGRNIPKRASLSLHRGEVLGIAGLVGAGRTEMVRALFGLDPIARGTVKIAGVTDRGAGVPKRIDQGFGLLSEDRKREGLATSLSIADNATLSRLGPFTRFGVLSLAARDRRTEELIERLAIKSRGPAQIASELSGGNQQKVAFARLLHQDADVVLLDEPTRGVDVGSKVEMYRLIGELARDGKAVLFISSYVPELLGVCDRIAVMHRGVLGDARPRGAWDERTVLDEATRGQASARRGDAP